MAEKSQKSLWLRYAPMNSVIFCNTNVGFITLLVQANQPLRELNFRQISLQAILQAFENETALISLPLFLLRLNIASEIT